MRNIQPFSFFETNIDIITMEDFKNPLIDDWEKPKTQKFQNIGVLPEDAKTSEEKTLQETSPIAPQNTPQNVSVLHLDVNISDEETLQELSPEIPQTIPQDISVLHLDTNTFDKNHFMNHLLKQKN